MNIQELADSLQEGGWAALGQGEPRPSQVNLAFVWGCLAIEDMPNMAKETVTKHLHDAFTIIEDYRVHGGTRPDHG